MPLQAPPGSTATTRIRSDGALFDHLLGRAATWGAITYEQDWMVESFLGVRGLRAAAGRARAWQEQLDRAAAAHGLTLQWCMSTPADFLQTLTLRRLTSIRTSGDYRYLFDNGLNWVWFLHTNALARALGLNAFKDVFLSDRAAEPYAEIEALLAALSTGPVGIGDRIGRADRALVLRTCREDGMLVKPDAPLAALDDCFRVPDLPRRAAADRRDLLGASGRPLGVRRRAARQPASRTDRRALCARATGRAAAAAAGARVRLAHRQLDAAGARRRLGCASSPGRIGTIASSARCCPAIGLCSATSASTPPSATAASPTIDASADTDDLRCPRRAAHHSEVHGYAPSAPIAVEAATFADRRALSRERRTPNRGAGSPTTAAGSSAWR